jgi:hypothetical protein
MMCFFAWTTRTRSDSSSRPHCRHRVFLYDTCMISEEDNCQYPSQKIAFLKLDLKNGKQQVGVFDRTVIENANDPRESDDLAAKDPLRRCPWATHVVLCRLIESP